MKKIFIAILILLMFTASALATVSDSTSRIKYAANGSTTTFDFTFGVNATGDIQVIYTDSADAETVLAETTHYSISATNNDYSSGGTVTTVATYASGTFITIVRNVTIEQESDFTEGMPTLYETFEDGLDDLTRVAQQLHEQNVRTPKLAVSSAYATTGYTFPDPVAGKVVGWNSGATDLTLFTPASGDTIDVASTIEVIGDHSNNIATAVTAIGVTETTLLIDVAVPGDTTTPSTLQLWFVGGGSLTGTVEIYSPAKVDASCSQAIYAGIITFTKGGKVCPEQWGAATDGTDMSTEFQAAVDALENAVNGGTIWLDPGSLYGIATTVDIQVRGGITIASNMGYPIISGANLLTGAIVPVAGGDLTNGMIRFLQPASGEGQYNISGLTFIDISDLNAEAGSDEDDWEARRVISMKSALDLDWFSVGTIRDSYFFLLKGSGIRLGTAARARALNLTFTYVGDTGKSALFIDTNSSSGLSAQSMEFDNIHMEVNYDAPYITLDAASIGNEFNGLSFEGFTDDEMGNDDTGDSTNSFIWNKGTFNIFSGIKLAVNNDTTNFSILNTGQFSQYSRIKVGQLYRLFNNTADHVSISDVTGDGGGNELATNHSFIETSGAYTHIDGINVKRQGRIVLNGARAKFTNSTLNLSSLTTSPLVNVTGLADNALITGNTFLNTNDGIDGITLGAATEVIVANNHFDGIGDSAANSGNPIDLNGTLVNTIIYGNTYTNINGTGIQNVSPLETSSISGYDRTIFGPYRVSAAAAAAADTFLIYIKFDGNNADFYIEIDIVGTFDTAEPFGQKVVFSGNLAADTLSPGGADMTEVVDHDQGGDLHIDLTAAASSGNKLIITATNSDGTHAFNGEITVRVLSRNDHVTLVYVDNDV